MGSPFPDIVVRYEGELLAQTSKLDILFDQFTRRIEYDSNRECGYAMCLVASGYIKDIKLQCVEVPHFSQ